VNETGTSRRVATIDTATSGSVHPDLSEIIGYEDVATAAAELIRKPLGLLNLYLELTHDRSLSHPILRLSVLPTLTIQATLAVRL
jgi:hypothetical protein